VDRVLTATTPGHTIDVLVTDRGVAVNPARRDLANILTAAGIQVTDIHELKSIAEEITGVPVRPPTGDRLVARWNIATAASSMWCGRPQEGRHDEKGLQKA